MDDLISKRSATERLIIAKTLLESILQDMPTAEKQGKWKHRKNWSMYVCDQCSFESREASRYCPNCGARMEESDE